MIKTVNEDSDDKSSNELIKKLVLLTKIKKERKLFEELHRLKEKQVCKVSQFKIV